MPIKVPRQYLPLRTKGDGRNKAVGIHKNRPRQVRLGEVDVRHLHALEIGLPDRQPRKIEIPEGAVEMDEEIEDIAGGIARCAWPASAQHSQNVAQCSLNAFSVRKPPASVGHRLENQPGLAFPDVLLRLGLNQGVLIEMPGAGGRSDNSLPLFLCSFGTLPACCSISWQTASTRRSVIYSITTLLRKARRTVLQQGAPA